jgi:uncharacterized protein YkwD
MDRRTTSVVILGALLVTIGLVSLLASRPSATALAGCATSSAGLDSSETALVGLINQARADAGLSQLSVSGNLSRAAAWKSEDQLTSPPLSHTDSLGRDPWKRIRDCEYPSGAGEIIALGFSSAQAVFGAWMNSPGHRARILDASYVAMGVGRAGNSWTVDFGLTADTGGGSSPAPILPPAPAASATPTTAGTVQVTPPTPASVPPSATPPATTANGTSVALSAGFNLVTYAGQRQLAGSAFDSLEGIELWVYGWNDGTKSWYRFFRPAPDYLNTLISIEPGRAYMIWVSEPAVWEY